MIALIDYGTGNMRSVLKALTAAGADVLQTCDPNEIRRASKVVLPGVGAFQKGMQELEVRGLVPVLMAIAERQTPLLGICLGMQLFFETSSERGHTPGLGLIGGKVAKFSSEHFVVPQTGWNQINQKMPSPLLDGVENGAYVYFNHSYYCIPSQADSIVCQTQYSCSFASAVQNGNVFGVQFHPEKSQRVGINIMKNFIERC